jgi:hypothetical protein
MEKIEPDIWLMKTKEEHINILAIKMTSRVGVISKPLTTITMETIYIDR